MTCCNGCFQWELATKEQRTRLSRPQGHTFCGVPTEGQMAAYVFGNRPHFENNRWYMVEAVPAFINKDGQQVWMIGGEYFTIKDGEVVILEDVVY